MQGQNTHKTVSLPNDRPKQKKKNRFFDIFAIVIPISIFLFLILCRPYHFAGRFNSPWLLLLADCTIIVWFVVVLVSEVWFVISFVVAAYRKNLRRVVFSLLLFIAILLTIQVHGSFINSPSFSFLAGLKQWAIPRAATDAIREWVKVSVGQEHDKPIPLERWPECIRILAPNKVEITNKYGATDVQYVMLTWSAAIIPHYYGITIAPENDGEYSYRKRAILEIEPGFYVWHYLGH